MRTAIRMKPGHAPFRGSRNDDRVTWLLLLAAWIVALVASLGALFVGEVMGQAPCVLCWFQRAFMFPLAVMLAVAVYMSDVHAHRYALPIAGVGWLIALYHSLLYFGVIAEAPTPCDAGPSCSSADMLVLGGLPLPLLSLTAFTAILALIFLAYRRFRQ